MVSSSHIVHTTPTEAWIILKAAGYFPRPLWDKIKPLQESSIDLSIIIPVYNAEEYLPRCLKSILMQKTNFTYEVVCINDGSNDGSLSILEKFAEVYSGKLVVVSQSNAGISISRNRGIAMAKGEYIGFIDNDDYVDENYVDIIMKNAREKHADIVQTAYSENTIDGKMIRIHNKKETDFNTSEMEPMFSLVSSYVWGVIRKSLFEKMRFPEGWWYERI